MSTSNTELANMAEQANAIVSNADKPIGHPGWWSQQHLFSMITTISAVLKIDVEKDDLRKIISATNDIGMTKYRIKMRIAMLLNPAQVALFNGVMSPEVAKSRIRALGFAFIELCKTIKLGKLSINEMAYDKGIRLLEAEYKRQLTKTKKKID